MIIDKELQKKMDVDKWLESELKRKDLCGEYDYCKYCNKKVDYPCATAYLLMSDKAKAKLEKLSFEEKLAKATDTVKEHYDNLISFVSEEKKVKIKMTRKHVAIKYGGKFIGQFTLTGNALKLHLALDPKAEKYCLGNFPHTDSSDKKSYAKTPFTVRLSSDLAIRRAKKLLNELFLTK